MLRFAKVGQWVQFLVTWPPKGKTQWSPSRPYLTWPLSGTGCSCCHLASGIPFLVPKEIWQCPCWNSSFPQDLNSGTLNTALCPLLLDLYPQDIQTHGFKCLQHVAYSPTNLSSPDFLPEVQICRSDCLFGISTRGMRGHLILTSFTLLQSSVILCNITLPPSLCPCPLICCFYFSLFLLRKIFECKRMLYLYTQHLDLRF